MTGTLKAKVGANWVPILGSGVDAANTARWNTSWGIVVMGSFPAGQMTFPPSTAGDLTSPMNLTTVVGRRYRIAAVWRAISTAGVTSGSLAFSDNGSIVPGDPWHWNSGNYDSQYAHWIFNGDGAAHVFKIRNGGNNSAQITYYGDSGSFCYIEDMGPIATTTIAPPVTSYPAWTPVTYQNGWVTFTGAAEQPCQYRKIGDIVYLRGTMSTGTVPAIAFTLPVGFRPPFNLRPLATNSGAAGRADLRPDGTYAPQVGTNTFWDINYQFSVTP